MARHLLLLPCCSASSSKRSLNNGSIVHTVTTTSTTTGMFKFCEVTATALLELLSEHDLLKCRKLGQVDSANRSVAQLVHETVS